MGDYWKNVRGEMETSALNENPHDDLIGSVDTRVSTWWAPETNALTIA